MTKVMSHIIGVRKNVDSQKGVRKAADSQKKGPQRKKFGNLCFNIYRFLSSAIFSSAAV